MTSSAPIPAISKLIDDLRHIYAENLEIPLENVTADADLAADLGIDSLTQDELAIMALERYGLSDKTGEVQPMNYPTLGDLADLIQSMSGEGDNGENS